SWPIAVDLFAGCGGVTEGLKQARFRVVAAVDVDPIACETYKRNHRKVKLFRRDIRLVNPNDIKKIIPNNKELDLLTVCAPCQPFSTQNKSRATDQRAPLILESLKFIQVLKPKVIFFENVPGLAESEVFFQLEKRLYVEGYRTIEPV